MAENTVWASLKLSEKIDYLKSNKFDCNFIVGSVPKNAETFQAHTFVLTSVSEVFERMFNGDFKESTAPYEIKITDVEPIIFEPFLEFIYYNNGGIKYCPIETWTKLVYLGKKYMIKELSDTCDGFIIGRLKSSYKSFNDLVCIFEYAHLHNDENLIKECSLRMRNSQDVLFQSEKIQQLSCIFDLSSSVFYNLLTKLHSKVTASVMFTLIETYAKINNLDESIDMNLSSMLKMIDFKSMTVKEFCAGPAKSKIINMKLCEKYDILFELCRMMK